MKAAMVAAPLALTLVPAAITMFMVLVLASGPPAAAVFLFFGAIATAVSLLAGLITSAVIGTRHSRWKKELREQIAAYGISGSEIDWFRNELRPAEKRALKQLTGSDPLLADAYSETLASRLTATRIKLRSARELRATEQRLRKISNLKVANAEDYARQLESDREKLSNINAKSRSMLAEAEARLQMIEAAGSRGGSFSEYEVALKKLENRADEEPLALEAAKLADEIRKELEEREEE
jgi:hypothetical protein